MHVIELSEPVVDGNEVRFEWTVTPETSLYERASFHLRFPPAVDIAAVPEGLWWRIALICLHNHWALLRPCRVILPVALAPGEAELWLRLIDATVASLEARIDGHDTGRRVELLDSGPPASLIPVAGTGVVSCFSAGRDGLAQAAMLDELGERPTLVTVTSPDPWSHEHTSRRRREVLEEIGRRRPLELIEVESDFRSCTRNTFAMEYRFAVHLLTDSLLYLAGAVAVAAARGARMALMASEAEVQQNSKRGGMVIQTRDLVYSAATHGALAAALAPAGIGIGSLTNSLRQFQVQRLLSDRYSDLRDLQYSCWAVEPDQRACSHCSECRGIGLNLVASGLSPALAGIDLSELLLSHADWEPGSRLSEPVPADELPVATAARAHEMQELRALAASSAEQVRPLLDGSRPPADRERALEIFGRMRARALSFEIEPEPGYRAGYLELLDPSLREGVRRIIDEHFTPAAPESYERMLANTRLLASWIAAPLRHAARPPRDRDPHQDADRPIVARPPTRVTLTPDELEPLRAQGLVPDPEPQLERPPGGRLIRVSETALDGNELAYVSECVTGNWISSAGSFIPRLQEAFAAAVGSRFAIACSSGTAALHLALAAAGIGEGDEVLMPAFTMIATANAACYVGADPVLVDADPRTWNLDPARLADKLTRRTRAVVAVHTYGIAAEMDPIREFAQRNGLVVIEDAAEAHGARYHGRRVGSIGDVASFSLYGNKILTSGEGGIVTTDDERIAEVARELRDHAFSRERHFWHRRLGFNYRMTNLQAAVGLAQVERFEQLLERRRANAERYREALAEIEGLQLPPELPGSVNWMFGVRVEDSFGIGRDELRRRLAAGGVETRTFFVPMHVQPVHHRRFAGQRYPVAEELGRTGLYLPSGPALEDDEIAYVADAVRASVEAVPGVAPSSA